MKSGITSLMTYLVLLGAVQYLALSMYLKVAENPWHPPFPIGF